MKNLLCVIGRHDWKVKHDKEGGRTRFADDRSVIAFAMTTLDRTAGRTPTPIQVTHRRPPNHPTQVRSRVAGELGVVVGALSDAHSLTICDPIAGGRLSLAFW